MDRGYFISNENKFEYGDNINVLVQFIHGDILRLLSKQQFSINTVSKI